MLGKEKNENGGKEKARSGREKLCVGEMGGIMGTWDKLQVHLRHDDKKGHEEKANAKGFFALFFSKVFAQKIDAKHASYSKGIAASHSKSK